MTDGLRLEALEVRMRDASLVRQDVTVPQGTVLTVMGPSGSGKSSLLAALLGTLPPGFAMTGRVWLNWREISALPLRARRLGVMFQDDVLFPHLSVAQNLAFAVPPAVRGAARRQAVDAALEAAGLDAFGSRDPATLSGGQRARVALMRALLAGPEALLLDEPFSRLDAGLRAQVRGFVLTQARARGLPVVMVTHDADDARAAGGPVVSPGGVVLHLPDPDASGPSGAME